VLSTGKIRRGCLECPYHGLLFDSAGRCVLIPANGINAKVPSGFDIAPKIIREAHGLVWYWHGEGEPSAVIPWLPGATEPGPGVAEYNYEPPVPYLRVLENLADFHHFPILHNTMLPGVGPRMDEMYADVEGDVVSFSATMRFEKPEFGRRDTLIRAWFGLPSLALIKFGGFDVNYVLTPIDDDRCWVYARYHHLKWHGMFSRIAGTLAARYDRAILEFQDKGVLVSQGDRPGDFSHFKLYDADRGLALLFGLRKRAILAAQRRYATAHSEPPEAAAGG
jgi:phenylpropionate dioxygenase-like ring-hydroxylating dioxygenase large terminal subunit